MIRAIIADDEPLSRRAVQQLLARHDDVTVVAECADGDATISAIDAHHPDVLFLDIRMPLATGLEIARARGSRSGSPSPSPSPSPNPRHTPPLVVFVSAFDEFALSAFELDAVDYVMKPLMEERFDVAIARVRDRLRGRRTYPQHLVSHVGSRDVILPLDTVTVIEADDVYAVVRVHGKRYLVRVSLDKLEESLDPSVFARVHRSYIVRLSRVSAVRRDKSGNLELVLGDTTVPVSRRRRPTIEPLLKPLAT